MDASKARQSLDQLEGIVTAHETTLRTQIKSQAQEIAGITKKTIGDSKLTTSEIISRTASYSDAARKAQINAGLAEGAEIKLPTPRSSESSGG